MSTVIPAMPGFWFLEVADVTPEHPAAESYLIRTPIVGWRVKDEDGGDDYNAAKPITALPVDTTDADYIFATAIEFPDGSVREKCDVERWDTADEFLASSVRWIEKQAARKAANAA